MREIKLTEIEKLANKHLNIVKEKGEDLYIFEKVTTQEINHHFQHLFDIRIKEELLKSTHVSIVLVDTKKQVIAGNSSLFLLNREHFNALHFWKKERVENRNVYIKITLNDFPDIEDVTQIVMHGYVQSPSVMQNSQAYLLHSGIHYRYLKFLKNLATICKDKNVFMLIESMGKLSLKKELENPQIDETALTFEERKNIGITRLESIASEKTARVLRLKEINNIYNERTFGKVFFSLPL